MSYILRRGCYHCRIKLETTSLGIDTGTYVRLYSGNNATAFYNRLFNASANGNAGAGDLAQVTTSNYECGYLATTGHYVAGFALTEIPTKQPYDIAAAGHSLAESNVWLTGDNIVFFIIAWPYDCSAFNLVTARSKAVQIAAEALVYVDQRFGLVPRSFLA